MVIFKMYKQSCRRAFDTENISMLVSGTLMILICSLFVNAGAPLQLNDTISDPNKIVMNTVIAAGSAGLLTALANHYRNTIWDENRSEMVDK
jgi:ammonia channel protein AmtB